MKTANRLLVAYTVMGFIWGFLFGWIAAFITLAELAHSGQIALQ